MNPEPSTSKLLNWLILPILILVGLIYYQILDFGFLLNFDDDSLILNSPEYKDFSWDNVKLVFSSFKDGLYHPITSLSWMLDYSLWGQDAFGFHLSNLILHLINTLLVFLLVKSISKKIEIGLIAALFFGIHPMHVENVAWLASRKDLMLGVFFFLSLYAYQGFVKDRSKLKYILAWIFALLAMMSKVAAIVLPLLFILLDWLDDQGSWKKQLLNKIPFLIPAVILIYFNYQAQSEYGYIRQLSEETTIIDQIFFVAYSAFYYLWKLFIPLELAPKNLYPEADSALPWFYYASAVFMLALAYLAFRFRKSRPFILFGFLFYLICIAPNLKIIPTGNDIVSNRYAYLAFFGIYLTIGHYLPKVGKISKYALLVIITIFWSRMTYVYADTYSDSRSVWTAVIDAHSDRGFGLAMAHNERGQVAYKNAQFKLAADDFDRALEVYPDLKRGLYNRAMLKEKSGEYEQALTDLNRLLSIEDSSVIALNLRSTVLGKMGRLEDALEDLKKAEEYQSENPELYNNMGIVQSMKGDYEDAEKSFEKAIELAPKFLQARMNLGKLYLDQKQPDSAIVHLAVVYNEDKDVFYNAYLLAKTYYEMEEADKAEIILKPFAEQQNQSAQIANQLYRDSLYRESLDYYAIAIGDKEIRNKSLYQRAQAFKALGETQNAIDDLLAVIESVPNGAFFYELALLYLEQENKEEACRFLDEAVKRKIKEAVEKKAEVCG
ncbi:MAG: hypothetical protein CMP59_09175 [Flavobacteriales bacterium]|nr:hypothetical protein [Flavobacteriales bacterium]